MGTQPLILIIDDEQGFRDIAEAKLTSKGFNVKTATSAKEGIELAQKVKPDLILMDVQMPDKDGIQATIELKENPATAETRIIFLTNLGDTWPSVTEINRKFAQEIGAIDYFKKSGDYDVLVEQIRAALNKPIEQSGNRIIYKK